MSELDIIKEVLKRMSKGEYLFELLDELGMTMKRWNEIKRKNPKIRKLWEQSHDAGFYYRVQRRNNER